MILETKYGDPPKPSCSIALVALGLKGCTNRKAIYRNPEGVEFPLFDDGTVIKQGSGEVIAYLLSGHALEGAVTRSDLLHGWISGLYLSQCPAAEEDHFVELVQQLAKGGLTVCIQTDGRNPALLERLIGLNALAKVQLNIPGPASVYEALYGSAPTKDELAKTIELVKAFPDHEIRFLATPLSGPEGARWPNRDEAGFSNITCLRSGSSLEVLL